MRPLIGIIILSMATLGWAAEAGLEEFKLVDGRTLVGTYDEDSEQLRLDGNVGTSIKVRPDAIASRKPHQGTAPKKASVPSMTSEEKAAAVEKFKAAQPAKEKEELLALAQKLDGDAADYVKDAERYRDQAKRDAEKFRIRMAQEGSTGETRVMTESVGLKNTAGNNSHILDNMERAKKADESARDCRRRAQEARSKANQIKIPSEQTQQPPSTTQGLPPSYPPGQPPAYPPGYQPGEQQPPYGVAPQQPGQGYVRPMSVVEIMNEIQKIDRQIGELQAKKDMLSRLLPPAPTEPAPTPPNPEPGTTATPTR